MAPRRNLNYPTLVTVHEIGESDWRGAARCWSPARGVQRIMTVIDREESRMKRYLIERVIPGAEHLSAEDLRGIATRSCNVLRTMGPDIQWVQSYVSQDRITCVYLAANEEIVLQHASRGGFPADRVAEVVAMMDPTTGDPRAASPDA